MKVCIALVLTLVLATTVPGCAGTIRSASISEAYKMYEKRRFTETLKMISRAENAQGVYAEQRAELSYLKARTYESLGEADTARALYRYVLEQHPHSQYGYLAIMQLGEKALE